MDVLQNGVRPLSDVASSSVSCLLLKSKAFFPKACVKTLSRRRKFYKAGVLGCTLGCKDISE